MPRTPVKRPARRVVPAGYPRFLTVLKDHIRQAQVKAALSVNSELIKLYWHIGREILLRQRKEGWGSKVVDRLGADLLAEFPEMTGLSPRNLLYMRAFADAYPDPSIVQQVAAHLATGRCRTGTPAKGWRGFVAYRSRGPYSGVSHTVRRGGQPLVRAAARWRRRSTRPPRWTD